MREAICAAIIKKEKVLVVRKEQAWILPGGKPNSGESDIECLCREVREELSGMELENFRFYNRFEGIAPHKGDLLQARVYFADTKVSNYTPSSEIDDVGWANRIEQYNFSDITKKIIKSLYDGGYLK
ncbi:NUDIX domain-containing protein [Candidatus Woesearchaeota archaeon]|nr:NUDIX domain-containing protein [Candidatus Woesearchaeota archaeon]